ncbi:MAG: hypothetical protein FD167_3650 [bacterium]|nr:MAG: hypothetical protein FD167_3650 [bacterium]
MKPKIFKIYKITFVLLLVFSILINCQTVHNPNKIAYLGTLNTQADGAKVEIKAWVKEVTGDEKLGLELITGESADTYPIAIIALKDGQRNPGKEKTLCIRGQILKRYEITEGMVYHIKDAEVIECY